MKQSGNIPRGYIERVEFDGWVLFEKPAAEPVSEWRSFKLVWCNRSRLAKANYWLAWNGERMAGHRDAALLEEHQPELHQRLQRWLLADAAKQSQEAA